MSPKFEDTETTMGDANDTIRAVVRGEAKVDALAEKVGDLKNALEEFIDRFDSDFEMVRDKLTGFAVATAAIEDLKRRQAGLEAKVDEKSDARQAEIATLSGRVTTLEADQKTLIVEKAKLETKLETISGKVYAFSGASAVIAFLAGKLIHT